MNRNATTINPVQFRVPYMCGDEPAIQNQPCIAFTRSLHVWG